MQTIVLMKKGEKKMGICEILTVLFVAFKLLGIIDWNWFFVLLPEIIAVAFYVIIIVLRIALEIYAKK